MSNYIMCMLIQGFYPFHDNAVEISFSAPLYLKCALISLDGMIVIFDDISIKVSFISKMSGESALIYRILTAKSSLNKYFTTEFYRGWKRSSAIATRCYAALLEKKSTFK